MLSKLAAVAKGALLFAHSEVALSLGRQAATSVVAVPGRIQKTCKCTFISNNIKLLKLLSACSMIMALYFSAKYADKRKLDQVLTCLENGTMPLVYDYQNCCDRKRELSKLKKALLSKKATEGKSGLFFVIIGPNGCGKSMLMKQLCHQNPMVSMQ